MKILLTGANGFVGSHILDSLRARSLPTAILLRPGSDTRFIRDHLGHVEVRHGSITEPASLAEAVSGISHVIHCAGLVKAQPISQFFDVNQIGTRNVVEAVNRAGVERLVHISSLAAAGPAPASAPAREQDSPRPVSAYGQSKLAAESEIRQHCRSEFVILRPPAVYGPRDYGFLSMFKAAKGHVLPRPPASQAISLVFVRDLAGSVVACLTHAAAVGKAYFVAAPEIVTTRNLAAEIATQMRTWTVPFPLSPALLWPVCVFEELRARITRKPRLLSLAKLSELRAPGWCCDPSLLRSELGFVCSTKRENGIAETLDWYKKEKWL